MSNPKISIVTPSFNCAGYIQECIDSVLAQNYPNFEHIIVDGASKDETVKILKTYPHLRWISEPDNNEAEALNKALRMVTGDIIGWLNADDRYIDGALKKIAEAAEQNPGVHLFYGKTLFIDEQGVPTHWVIPLVPINLSTLTRWFNLNLFQPSIFFSRQLYQNVGAFREDLKYGIDYEYWFRIASKGYQFYFVDQAFSRAMIYRAGGKTETPYAVKAQEWLEICTSYHSFLSPGELPHFWKDYYTFRIHHEKIHYNDVPLTFPDNIEATVGLLLACRQTGNFNPELYHNLISENPHCDKSDFFGLFGECLRQHALLDDAKKVFEWALALESNDPKICHRFATKNWDEISILRD